ncbi:unnamed protein product [Pleuronectes platessa]|uniref:Uncharacterized protein n=1 Tax=Pleuronectes platessa TaxID=8262 RepID=A0A9N7W331_PLEPL|nr:unnamed protein product [Pleuronectes platessa]
MNSAASGSGGCGDTGARSRDKRGKARLSRSSRAGQERAVGAPVQTRDSGCSLRGVPRTRRLGSVPLGQLRSPGSDSWFLPDVRLQSRWAVCCLPETTEPEAALPRPPPAL